MVETPSTCFLQYPQVPINCCNSFLDWSICLEELLHFLLNKYPNVTSLLGPWHFSGGISISASCSASHMAGAASPVSSWESSPIRCHPYVGTVSHLGGVRWEQLSKCSMSSSGWRLVPLRSLLKGYFNIIHLPREKQIPFCPFLVREP